MDHIRIPSPSAILGPLPAVSPTCSKVPVSTQNAASTQTATTTHTNKPKQSKSRNGCITCKTKRLKCDESKPTCLQCKKRNVECGGYKKDFKWRPFGESSVPGKSAVPKGKKVTPSPPTGKSTLRSQPLSGTQRGGRRHSLNTNDSPHSQQSSTKGIPSARSSQSPEDQKDLSVSIDHLFGHSFPGSFGDDAGVPPPVEFTAMEQTPWLSNMLFPPVSNRDQIIFNEKTLESPPKSDNFSFEALLEGDGDEIEEIIRQPDQGIETGILDFTEICMPPHSQQSNLSSGLLREPTFSVASPEMLVLHFDRSTCGILSVKDGVHENPWRTVVWPLAKETPALYHAIFALAAFHSSKENPTLRVHGVDHMRQSITCMVQDIRNMRADAALATSLALAFADTWDQNTRTCIQHLRGAKALVSQVVEFGLQGGIDERDLSQVRFLYNTWLYMDVIARLTSREEQGDQDPEAPFLRLPENTVHEIDPLMGCAATLFPLINQVARLIQRVRRTESNSISLISQAIELKRLVEQWEPPDWFEPPEDPTSEVQHNIQTAHAYRWATLLYLHQAVPEMPSEPAPSLAKRVLILLATVPPSSRTTIIQMFPLLVAGCEAEQEEDRTWVLNRWSAIQSRLMLGSIDRCIEVVREVWARRDASEAEKQHRQQLRGRGLSNPSGEALGKDRIFYGGHSVVASSRRGSAVSSLENIEFDKTVRGRSHWVYVMQEWGWEVFLG